MSLSKDSLPYGNTIENELDIGTETIASTKKFVEGMRHQGLSDEDAVKELVDNSFDAGANNIYIDTWDEKGSVFISIQDDGRGMDANELGRCIAFGVSGTAVDPFHKIGRFGFGMPTAILSKTKYADVYSSQGNFNYNYNKLDLDWMMSNNSLNLFKSAPRNPLVKYPKLRKFEMGTIVVLKNCDRLDYKKHSTVAEHLVRDLSEVYRFFIAEGRKISVNGTLLKLYDPLMVLKDHQYREKILNGLGNLSEDEKINRGYSRGYETLPIPIEYTDNDGKSGISYIKLNMALLPMDDMYSIYGQKKAADEFEVSLKRQGFYLIRNGRQIADGQTLGILERHNDWNYFRCEIHFDSMLDEEFGIQINKSRFSLSRSAQTKINNEIQKHLRQVKKDIEEIRRKYDKKSKPNKNPATIGLAEKVIQATPLDTTKKAKQASEAETKKLIDEEIKTITDDKKLDETEKKIKIETLKTAAENKLRYTFDTVDHMHGPVFLWKYDGGLTRIFINMEHPFYKYFWEPMSNNETYKNLLKLLIFSLVKSEQKHEEADSEKRSLTYNELHWIWGNALRKALNNPEFLKDASLITEDQ